MAVRGDTIQSLGDNAQVLRLAGPQTKKLDMKGRTVVPGLIDTHVHIDSHFGKDGRANPIPGHNIPFAVLGTIILWFGWFGFNPGSTLAVVTGHHLGYFAYVALTTNLAAAAGALGGIATAWVVLRKPDVSMMLNGAIAALVAITAASGFVAPWAAVVVGFVAAVVAVVAVPLVERVGIDDPIGAVAVHGLAGVWGTLATGLFAVPALASNLATGSGGLVYTGSFHQLGVQALGLVAVGAAESGRPVLMFLTKEAVRLALPGVALGTSCAGCPPIEDLAKRYEAAGGKYYVCPICFNAKELDSEQLIEGAELNGTVPMWNWIGDEPATTFSY
jgi:predicted peroxiredoxin